MSTINLKLIAKDDDLIRDEVEQIDWSDDCDSSQDNNHTPTEDFDLEEFECVDEEGEADAHDKDDTRKQSSSDSRAREKRRFDSNETETRDRHGFSRKRKTSLSARKERGGSRRMDYEKKRRSEFKSEDATFEDLEEIDCIEDDVESVSGAINCIASPSDDSHGVDSDMAACSSSLQSPDRIDSAGDLSEDDADEFPDLCEDIDVEAAVRAACLPESEETILNVSLADKEAGSRDDTVSTKEAKVVHSNGNGCTDKQRSINQSNGTGKREEEKSSERQRRCRSPVRRRSRSRGPVARTPSPIRRRLKPPPGRREQNNHKAEVQPSIKNARSNTTTDVPSNVRRQDVSTSKSAKMSTANQKSAGRSHGAVPEDFTATRVEMRRFIADLHANDKQHRKDDSTRNTHRSSVAKPQNISSPPVFVEVKKKH